MTPQRKRVQACYTLNLVKRTIYDSLICAVVVVSGRVVVYSTHIDIYIWYIKCELVTCAAPLLKMYTKQCEEARAAHAFSHVKSVGIKTIYFAT